MIKLAMVRHGQTNDNFKRLVQGRIDNPLNAHGKKQALILAKNLIKENKTFDAILSSPLSRALETAYIVSKQLNYQEPIEIVQHFVERNFFHLDGMSVDDAMPLVRTKGYKYPGFEDDEKIIKRVINATYNLLKLHDGKSLLCVAHSHVLKSLLVYSDPKKFSFADYSLTNGDIIYFEVYEDKIIFKEHISHPEGAL